MRVASGVAAVFLAWFGVWLARYGVREWRNAGGVPLSQRLRGGWLDDESLAAADRGGVLIGLVFMFFAVALAAVALGGNGLGAGTGLAPVWGSMAGAGFAGGFACGGLYGLISLFNRPKFLVPPQHRGEAGGLAGRRLRRREGVPMRNAKSAPDAVDRALFERMLAASKPVSVVPAGQAVIVVARRATEGTRDSRRDYVVVVDGRPVARVRRGRTTEVAVAPGRHSVLMKINWGTSRMLAVDVRPGEVIRLACEPGGPDAVPLRDVTTNRASYISLTRV